MRKLAILGAAIGVLALPTGASANHIAGATYSGEFTTGLGGTVTIDVAGSGTTVDFNSAGFGQAGCENNSVGRDDIPVSNHSFSFSDSTPFVSVIGSFPTGGLAMGSAQISGVCNSGSQSWRAAAGPVVDGMVQRSSDPFAENGNDVWNTTGANQTRSWAAKRGQVREFDIVLQNDGNETGPFSADGCGSSRDFAVTYKYLGNNVTNQVVTGNFTRNVFEGDIETIDMRIKPKSSANVGQVKTCAVREESEVNVDVVKAKLTVRRG